VGWRFSYDGIRRYFKPFSNLEGCRAIAENHKAKWYYLKLVFSSSRSQTQSKKDRGMTNLTTLADRIEGPACPECGKELERGEDPFGITYQCLASDCLSLFDADEIDVAALRAKAESAV
jgi:hypothetical protein